LLLPLKEQVPLVHLGPRKGLDADQAILQVTLGDLHGPVRGAIVYEIHLYTLFEEVLQTTGDEALLIVRSQYRYDTYGIFFSPPPYGSSQSQHPISSS
jgi:hypothetical protein